ncbi:MAG TPA: HAMP domain-containing sensor histidine kinase, partial [Cellvibrionaceae bacterium]
MQTSESISPAHLMVSNQKSFFKRLMTENHLQRGLIIWVTLAVVLPGALMAAMVILENREANILNRSHQAADRYADLMQSGLSLPLWNVAPNLGQPIIDSVKIDPAISKIQVKTNDQDLFISFEAPSLKAISSNNFIHIVRPISYNQQNLGTLDLIYSLEPARQKASQETKQLITIISMQLIISLTVLIGFLHRRIIYPLRQLRIFANGIAQGNLSSQAPGLNPDELGDLASDLEKMRQSLESNIQNLEHHVNERTRELSQSNQQLSATLEQLKLTQGHLIQSEKLAALGSLVAGVAHELNTPIGNGLSVASTLTQTCQNFATTLDSGMTKSALKAFVADVTEGNEIINRNLNKASELVSGFKQVAMDRTSAQRRTFNLLEFLNDTYLTLTPTFRRTAIKVSIECPEDIELNSYPGPLGQVITNLLNNTLIHAFDSDSTGQVDIHASRQGELVKIDVKDNGKGILAEHIGKIFDPFFTTKLGKGGNGLGMHIVHNIVSGLLGGSISVYSTPNKGSCFTLLLPPTAPQTPDPDAEHLK